MSLLLPFHHVVFLASSHYIFALLLHPHFISPSFISLFALIPPSTSLPPLHAVALPIPRSPVYILWRLNSLLIASQCKERKKTEKRKEKESLHHMTLFLRSRHGCLLQDKQPSTVYTPKILLSSSHTLNP